MKNVVLGILGSRLDAGQRGRRWDAWRPSVAICQHEDLLVDRFDLLYLPRDVGLAEQVSRDIQQISPETAVRLHLLDLKDPWDFESTYDSLFNLAAELVCDLEKERLLLHITTGTHVQQICMFLLCESRHLPGQLLQASPPKRKGEGPGTYNRIDLDLSKYDRIAARFQVEHDSGSAFLKSGISTRSANYNTIIDRIERVAIQSNAPVLLTGPTGAGKTQLARRIYELKRQRAQFAGRLVEVNCATLRGDGAMSTLFGHTKGAFTGAQTARAGLLKEAHGGMLFLDEVGELGLDEQAMLLLAIEERKYLPVGADRETISQFLLIAGTNRDLQQAVASGAFREDLLARINLWTFNLPGLIDRREDIEPNLDYELERFAASEGRKVAMGKEARQTFMQFAVSSEARWLGNFRDLTAAVTRMATLADGGRITVVDVEHEIARLKQAWQRGSAAPHGGDTDLQTSELSSVLSTIQLAALDRFEMAQLLDVVRVCRESDSLSDAGRTLFAVSRLEKAKPNDADRLRKYLARFELTFDTLGTSTPCRTTSVDD
ncbi:RNA repair transcriptional activator RtcR [Aureliella helgolandensis]|uniref:Nif-specific regulatory protein n=1 Tax=Aureliella helgolandensis TaxID=2527968 RepID=A0A518G299_9BACT|nr:RNA repair transcriptional activator RtcR [Aureliella helgolandensis]QDV22747.1 Nif-specific regulatory protein [Aureliella helgolandensis]